MNRCPYQWDAALMLTAWVTVPVCAMRWVAHTKSLSQVHKGYFGNAYTGCRFDLCRENQCSAGSQCNPANGQCECREGYALINGVCQSPLWLVLRLTSFYRLSVRLNQLLQLKISMVMLWATYSPRSMVQTITPQTSIVSILSLHRVLMGTVNFLSSKYAFTFEYRSKAHATRFILNIPLLWKRLAHVATIDWKFLTLKMLVT